MAFQYKHVLLIGATSGIGSAMADRLITAGVKVTAVGRRKDRLEAFVKKNGVEKASFLPFDITNLAAIPEFARDAMTIHPTIDAVFLNAGVQRGYDWSKPATISLDEFNWEISTNFTSLVALVHAFLPYLLAKKNEPTSFIFTGSNLALVPAPSLSAYSASKAALNAFIYCLRAELSETNIKVFEISPPPVQTELHDPRMGVTEGRKLGMPLSAFTEEAFTELAAGKEEIVIGAVGPKEHFDAILENRGKAFKWLVGVMKKSGH